MTPLSPIERELLARRFYQPEYPTGMTREEVAEAMGMSLEAVRDMEFDITDKLEDYFKPDEPAEWLPASLVAHTDGQGEWECWTCQDYSELDVCECDSHAECFLFLQDHVQKMANAVVGMVS